PINSAATKGTITKAKCMVVFFDRTRYSKTPIVKNPAIVNISVSPLYKSYNFISNHFSSVQVKMNITLETHNLYKIYCIKLIYFVLLVLVSNPYFDRPSIRNYLHFY